MKTLKIFDDNGTETYSGACLVNTVIFRGRIHGEIRKINQNFMKFTIRLSNGKDSTLNQWRKPTFATCCIFSPQVAIIEQEYKTEDEIWLIGKYSEKEYNGQIHREFYVRDIIPKSKYKSIENKKEPASQASFANDDLPF